MRAYLRQPDTTLIVVLSNGDQEIERLVVADADAACAAAVRMLYRRGSDLKGGDTLRVLAPG
jgi:hypothetical protein